MKEGWEYKELGEITTSINGLWKGEKDPFVRVGVIRNANFTKDITLDFSKIEYLDVEEKQYKNRKLQKGDLIVEKSGGSEKQPVGRTVLFNSEGEFSVSNFTSILRINNQNEITPEFLYKYLLYIYKEGKTKEMQKATTGIHNIIYDKFLAILIPILSLAEQQQIVSFLDSEFENIDALKANAETQLQAAKDLFQKALKEMLTPKEGWEEKKLGEIAEITRGKRFVRADIVDEGIPCIHYGDIYTYYGLSVTKTKGCINPELAKKMRFAKKNDVIVVQAGENNWDIGVGIAYFGEEPAAVHDACFILRHEQNPMFLTYYLRSYNYHLYLLDYVHEGKICSFLKPALENAPIPLPPLPEQQQIVAKLDAISARIKILQSNYEQTITLCNDLKQSLLKKIFE